ncbi:MAG: hypothetical protein AAB839_03360 [Patescibacteria group bacterium]
MCLRMLSKNDLHLLRGMFDNFHGVLRTELQEMFDEHGRTQKREIRDEMHSLLRAQKVEIVSEITEFIDSAILPQISDLDRDTRMVKQLLKLA